MFLVSSALVAAFMAASSPLRVCADPNNLPYSNAQGAGFENKIAALVAQALGRQLVYVWHPARRGFIRETLNAGVCDLVMSVPAGFGPALPTRPYYRSTYVFVSRRDYGAHVTSLDDPRLRTLRIGIQITGNDYSNPPAAEALARRHLGSNVRGFTVYGDYAQPEPQRPVLDAVVRGDVDTAIVWGPLAGFYARDPQSPLVIQPVTPAHDGSALPFVFDIAMATRRGDTALHAALDHVITVQHARIRQILRTYGVPLV
jgi:quinoprotein dehydrogenase-associated probable ABC transporter substrate-binding protein